MSAVNSHETSSTKAEQASPRATVEKSGSKAEVFNPIWARLATRAQFKLRIGASEDVYEQEVGLIRTRRRWLAEQRAGLEARLADLGRYSIGVESVAALRTRMEDRLDRATPQDRRFVLEAVGTRVLAAGDGTWEVELEIPQEVTDRELRPLQLVNTDPGTSVHDR